MRKQIRVLLSLIFLFGVIVTILVLTIVISPYFMTILFAIHGSSAVFATFILCRKNRRFETRTRWFAFICLVPIFGIVSYWFFGQAYKYKKTAHYKYKNIEDFTNKKTELTSKDITENLEMSSPHFAKAFLNANALQNDVIFKNTQTQILDNGANFFTDLIKEIRKSEKYILMNFYIIRDGELLQNLINELEIASKRGVNVYVIYDFLGCYTIFSNKTIKRMKESGMKVIPFSKIHLPFINWTANYRDHRKDVSIDGRVGYIGGINIGDEYINISKKFGFWNDMQIKLTGDAVRGIEKTFASDWYFCMKNKQKITDLEPSVCQKNKTVSVNDDFVQVMTTGPNHQTSIHLDALMNLITNAKKRIWIVTPYFVPPMEIINALKSAAISGIDVKILLPGKTDKTLVLEVSKRWTRELYDAGVEIYSIYNTFNHTKAFLFDDDISFVGSTNLDFRSLFSDQQTMLLVKSKTLTKELALKIIHDGDKSFKYHLRPNDELNLFYKSAIACSNLMIPLL
ncbi:cardiolipin synthase [Mesoplasma photuris]|uniref:cardiolipin synthase n=1 Tax=Mesoplasma photuris TaxID=217731 RepID=UPI0004E24B2D|nr:cardiolipin synthase [Mesoplasma photuris]